MSLRTRLLLAFTSALLIAFALFTFWMRGLLRDSYGQSVEEILVDVSQLLASVAEKAPQSYGAIFDHFKERRFQARIFDFDKERPTIDSYLTDERGTVIYSSLSPADVGKNFSQWNDVARTLAGKYGVRSTRRIPGEQKTSVFYVGAPVKGSDGKIAGSVSAIKDRVGIAAIVERALWKIGVLAVLVLLLTSLFASMVFVWLTQPLRKLQAYAVAVGQGKKAVLPELSGAEIRGLGNSFEEMRTALEGKKTIERFTQALTHEIKSPLSAIQGAAELALEGDMDPERRAKFLGNIVSESKRARIILERLLEISALEAKNELDKVERVGLREAAQAEIEGLMGVWEAKKVRVAFDGGDEAVEGDPFLVRQCIRNLLSNAIDFSPTQASVRVSVGKKDDLIELSVEDGGPGVPEFARSKVFDKFYSLERPGTGRKSTGLGLSFVKEVMELHGGSVRLESPVPGRASGTRAQLVFPAYGLRRSMAHG